MFVETSRKYALLPKTEIRLKIIDLFATYYIFNGKEVYLIKRSQRASFLMSANKLVSLRNFNNSKLLNSC